MNNPVLSICIPTYNRADFLKVCLASIISQLTTKPHSEAIEIVVSNNGSTDHTDEVVKEFQSIFPRITYCKNTTNIGFDKNVLQVVEKAKGKYCWLLGDDDALFENSLAYILPYLEKNDIDYFLANYWGYNTSLTAKALSKPNLDLTHNQEYATLSDFVTSLNNFQNMVGYFGGMSCQIFKRKFWVDMADKEIFIGTQTIHLFIILKAFKNRPSMVIAEPLVKTRAENMRWDTFPGLETMHARAKLTNDALLWIMNMYGIPYSKAKLRLEYYKGLWYSQLLYGAKKTIFRSKKMSSLAKKILGK